MRRDPAGTFAAALQFAGHVATAQEIARAVTLADFGKLKAQEAEKGVREAPRPKAGGNFFRRGEAGGWRGELSAEQVARIEAAHGAMMRRLGYTAGEGLPRPTVRKKANERHLSRHLPLEAVKLLPARIWTVPKTLRPDSCRPDPSGVPHHRRRARDEPLPPAQQGSSRACAQRSAASTASARGSLEAGFCPVRRLPSRTT